MATRYSSTTIFANYNLPFETFILFVFFLIFWTGTAHAEIFGGIDIGSTGIKCIAIEVKDGKQSIIPQSENSENLGLAGAIQQHPNKPPIFDRDTLIEAARIIKEQVAGLKTTYNATKVFAAVSSGLAEASRGDESASSALQQLLDYFNKESQLGLSADVIAISYHLEATLTFKAIANDDGRAFVIDVGGGNAKFATRQKADAIQYGAKSFSKPFELQATKSAAIAKLTSDVDQHLQNFPGIRSVTTIYVSGGPAYIVSTLLQPDHIASNPKGFHDLGLLELNGELATVTEATNLETLFDNVLNTKVTTEAARRNLLRAKNIYNLPQLQAGTTVLGKLVERAQKISGASKVQFYGDGQTAWIRGWIATQIEAPPTPLEQRVKDLEDRIDDHETRLQKIEEKIEIISSARLAPSPNADHLKYLRELPNIKSQLEGIANSMNVLSHFADTELYKIGKSVNNNASETLKIAENIQRILIANKTPNPYQHVPEPPPGQDLGQEVRDDATSRQGDIALYEAAIKAGRDFNWKDASNNFELFLDKNKADPLAWYYYGLCQLKLGHETTGTIAIVRAAILIDDGKGSLEEICHEIEHIQGPLRNHSSWLLQQVRGFHARIRH